MSEEHTDQGVPKVKKRKPGTISYRDHTGVILDDGRSIKDDYTGMIYESSLFWVYFWDIEEGRPPPSLYFQAPTLPPVAVRAITPPPFSLFDNSDEEGEEESEDRNTEYYDQPKRRHRTPSFRDDDVDDVIFQLDLEESTVEKENNFILESPIDELLTEMDSHLDQLKRITKSRDQN